MADLVIFGQSAKQQMVDRCCVKGWRCVGSHQELYRGKTYQVLLTTISNTLTTINNFQIRQKSLESLHSRQARNSRQAQNCFAPFRQSAQQSTSSRRSLIIFRTGSSLPFFQSHQYRNHGHYDACHQAIRKEGIRAFRQGH